MKEDELLVKAGFVKGDLLGKFLGYSEDDWAEHVKKIPKKEFEKIANNHMIEYRKDQLMSSGYPKPKQIYRLTFESYQMSVEEVYFWIMDYLTEGWGFPIVHKVTDLFTAAEHSAFFGHAQQKLGLQQDKVSQFLKGISEMIKALFQIVREIRILKERISYYEDSYAEESKSRESAEITLKGFFIDMAEGGAKNPSSVFGMARELQFSTLPDLFFSYHPMTDKQIDDVVDNLDFNPNVLRVLKRKLRNYLTWKKHTFEEIRNRHVFTLKYLRQHFDVIKMYSAWIKPYLRNIKRLSLDTEKQLSPNLIAAFEGSMIEVEFLCQKVPEGNKNYYSVIIVHIDYRTRPTMSYSQEYQRGPIHVGKAEVTMRSYAWTQKQIDSYLKMREQEDLEFIGMVDDSINNAIESLGEELERYLREAGEEIEFEKEQKKEEKREPSMLESFFGPSKPKKPKKPKKKSRSHRAIEKFKNEKEIGKAEGDATKGMWNCYKNYKKAHGFIAW